ncbi:hypothetical protein OTT_0347 [Orientia tsutsugamushi str. Ikeda]|uniref:Uncharacterized protein n=1 Tax=Orientia tsutsugamushi (strain Ikeda) TaxID=334380 RepID=B3CQA9_ORITI|nr:hypothetical protein [Orientia tsutsugamushi]BAG39805.1 hypothetical protein OTT_0347 [Orientia tsutsugamushi str. Ikeda]
MYEDIPETDINKLYDEFINHSYEINLVQHFESVNRSNNHDNISVSGSTDKIALSGYINLISCYSALFNKDCIELKNITYHLEQMFKSTFNIKLFRDKFRFWEKLCNGECVNDDFGILFASMPQNADTYTDAKYITKLNLQTIQSTELHKKMKDLRHRGETYIALDTVHNVGNVCYGVHSNIIKYNNTNPDHGFLYNPTGTVLFKHDHIAKSKSPNDYDELKKIDELRKRDGLTDEVIFTEIRYMIRGYLVIDDIRPKICHAVDADEVMLLEPTHVNKIPVIGSSYDNCTTQTVREVLRHNLPEEIFRELYDFITLVPYSSKLEMLESVIGRLSSPNIKYSTELPTLESLTADEVKENFLSIFQFKVNNILGIEPTVPIYDLHLIELTRHLDVNAPLVLYSEGLKFLAESKAIYLINAGVIKANSDQSQAMIDTELSGLLIPEQFVIKYHDHYSKGYNLITKKCLLMDVFINESLLDTTPIDGNNQSNTKTNLDSINAEDKKYIVQKLFSSTLKDHDFYLTKEILLVIKEVLLQSIEHTLKGKFLNNSPLPLDIKDEIVNSCRRFCLQNHKIDLPVRAQIAGDNYSSKNALKNLKLDIETAIIPKGHVAKIKRELELELRQKC